MCDVRLHRPMQQLNECILSFKRVLKSGEIWISDNKGGERARKLTVEEKIAFEIEIKKLTETCRAISPTRSPKMSPYWD